MLRQFDPRQYLRDSFDYYKRKPAQLRLEFLSGVTLALIEVPESIAFAFMAGLSPYYGMASVFWVGTLTGLFGGRCARCTDVLDSCIYKWLLHQVCPYAHGTNPRCSNTNLTQTKTDPP